MVGSPGARTGGPCGPDAPGHRAVAAHHACDGLERGALRTVLQHHVASPVAVANFYPHRSGLAAPVRVVVDLLLTQLRRDSLLSRIDKLA